MEIRPERPGDEAAIADVIEAAFLLAKHCDGTEAQIVERLRGSGALTLSLVAVEEDSVIGHVAFSPVTIDGEDRQWFGLGPVAVRPDRQGKGTGSALIREGLNRLRGAGAMGCVLVGEPEYYGRFGFVADSRLAYPELPAEYFQALPFGGDLPTGTVAYHPAFG